MFLRLESASIDKKGKKPKSEIHVIGNKIVALTKEFQSKEEIIVNEKINIEHGRGRR